MGSSGSCISSGIRPFRLTSHAHSLSNLEHIPFIFYFLFFCNTQEGLLSFAQTGDSDLLGVRAHRTANWASFIYAKKHTISILRTGCKVIGYTFAKQSYWYRLRGLHVYKAILLAQTSWAFVQI